MLHNKKNLKYVEKRQTLTKPQMKYGYDHRRYVRLTKGVDSCQGTAVYWKGKRGESEQDRNCLHKKRKEKKSHRREVGTRS